jgi:hypothetical protein
MFSWLAMVMEQKRSKPKAMPSNGMRNGIKVVNGGI